MNWKVIRIDGESKMMDTLRSIFPNCEPNQDNFVLFSTSGIHGSYVTIEDTPNGDCVTVLILKPRILQFLYGNVLIRDEDDRQFLMDLRARSLSIASKIGLSESSQRSLSPPKSIVTPAGS